MSEQDMSVEEILAKCRELDGEGGGAAPAPAPEAAAEPAAEPAAESAPAAAPAPSGKKPSEMSVAEMLAAARGEKSKPAAKAAPKKEKPAAKPKPAAKADSGASPKREGPMDTTSILAMARGGGEKKGPVSKAEAAAKAKPGAPKGKPKIEVPPMPEKPGYAQPAVAMADGDDENRRGFMASVVGVFAGSSLAVGFTSLALTHLLWLLGLARFMFPNILIEPPTKFKVGFPGDYGPGQVQTKFKAQFGVWIVRHEYQGQLQIYAIQSVCTHLGCTPNWLEAEQKFKCPCHGSGFYKDGINFEGPAPRPLERFGIRLADDGQLEVDKSRKFFEEKGEWKDAASFVPV